MKKFLSLTLTLAILLTVIVVGIASASAQSFDTAIKIGGVTYVADIGDTFTYTVTLTSDKLLSAGQIEIPANFTVLKGDTEAALNENIEDTAPIIADTAQVVRFDAASKKGLVGYAVNFATDGSYDFTAAKTAVTMNFTVQKAGTVDMTPVLREFVDSDLNDLIDINGNVVSGNVTASAAVNLAVQNNNSVKAPRISSFGNTAAGLRVNWKAVSGAGYYRVFRLNNGRWATVGTVNTNYFVDKNVTSGTAYTYTVRAMDAKAKSFVSAYVTAGWTFTYIAQPAIKGFESTKEGLTLSWDAVDGAAAYRIVRKNGTKWTTLADTEGTSYLDADVVLGTQYTYTIRCLNKKGAFASSYHTAGFSSYFLGAPQMKSVGNYYGYVSVRWNALTGAEKYRVFRRTADTDWYEIADTADAYYNDRVVDSGTTYFYTVRCISADGTRYTSPRDEAGMSVHYIAPPVINKFNNTAAGTVISWAAVEGAEKYRVFRMNAKNKWQTVADTTEPTYTDTNVKSGTAYTYTVRCVSADGKAFTSAYNTKGWKNTYLAAPTVTAVGNYVGYVRVNWAKVNGAAKYRVFRKTGDGGWQKIGDTTGLYWNDKTVVSGTNYRYTVRCISADGRAYTSPFNNGRAIKYIAAPAIRSLAKVSGGVKLTWTKSNGAAKYRIFRKVGSGSWAKLADTTALTWTDKTVRSGYKYSYTVRCITADGKAFTSAYNTTGKSITY